MASGRGGWYGLLGGTTKGSGPVGRPSTPSVMSGSFAGIFAFFSTFLGCFLGSDSMVIFILNGVFCGLPGDFYAQRGDPRPLAAGSVRSAAAARCAASEGLGNG